MAVDSTNDENLVTGEKEGVGFKETTSNSFTRQAPRPPLSASQFIMRASAVVGLLAFSWRLPDIWAATSRLIVHRTTPNLDACHGYSASAIQTTSNALTAQLQLISGSCNVYGPDLQSLSLTVTYETGQ
jgi:hypothetical protein